MIRKEQSGFTLVELLVTIGVAGLMITGIVNLYITIETTQRRTYNTELATRAGEKQIESLRNSQYNTLDPGVDIDFTDQLPADLPSPKSGTVAVSQPADGLRRVDVIITYKDGASNRTVKQSSLIGIIGIAQ